MEKEKMCIALILMEKKGGSYIQRSGREGARPEGSWNLREKIDSSRKSGTYINCF